MQTTDNNIPKKPQYYLNDTTISNKIRLLLGNDIRSFIIIVEGNDDKKLLKHVLINCYVENLAGKQNVIMEVEKINLFNVIGIVDMDYEKENNIDRIFFYDYCCLEMMLISEKTIREKIKNEYSIIEDNLIIDDSLIKKILRELLFISLIRKYNSYHKLEISFSPLNNILECYNINEKKIDNKNVLELLKKQTTNQNIIINYGIDKILNNINEIEKIENCKIESLYNITNGHDFFRIISTHATNNNQEKLWSFLRGAYNKDLFKKTKLYNALLEYQNRTNTNFL